MSETTQPTGPGGTAHPVTAAIALMERAREGLADVALWGLYDADVRAATVRSVELEDRLAELRTRLVDEVKSREAYADAGAPSVAVWLANQTRLTKRTAFAATALATSLAAHPATRAAVAAGEVRVEQARVIAAAVDALPKEVEAWVPVEAERLLLAEAKSHDARDLKILGLRILAVIDPAAAEEAEAKALAKEEEHAWESTELTLADDGHGVTRVKGRIPTPTAAMLRKALLALAAPKPQAATRAADSTDDQSTDAAAEDSAAIRRPSAKRLGQAFCELIESLKVDNLPQAGGSDATAVVLMGLDTLLGGVRPAHLDTGEPITAGEARRMACTAGLVPAVLDGSSQVLDLGRRQRFHSKTQRLALIASRRGCEAEGCDYPAHLCHVHHPIPWSKGGPTDLTGQLLCPWHHRLIHRDTHDHTTTAAGKIRFTRRC